MATKEQNQATTRREFVKKAVYVAPAVLSLKAAPSFAKTGSVNAEATQAAEKAVAGQPRFL